MSLEETGAPLWATQSKQGRLSHDSPAQRVTRSTETQWKLRDLQSRAVGQSQGESHHDLTRWKAKSILEVALEM